MTPSGRATRASTKLATTRSRERATGFWRDNRSYIISDEEDAAYGRHNISSRKLKKKRKETKNILLVKNRKEIVKQSCIQIRLPYDILRIVLDFLDPVSLAQCAQVCQEWNIILQHDIIWRASLENCFSTSVSIPEHLTNREFIEVCAASICGLCHERKTGHIKSYFIFGFAACDPCFKENTVCAITARKMILEEDLPLDLVQTVPHENIQVGRAPVWQSTMESRFWPADLKSIIEESFYYHNLDELRAWIQHRADSSASLMKAIKPLRMFQQSYHSEVARIKRDLSNYKLRSKWLQIDNLAQGIGISEERQSWIYKCDYLSRPLMTPVPFTETELRQIARDLPNELEKAEMESKKQSLLRRAEKELKNIITRTISRTSFAYPRMLFKPFERPLPSTELIQLYKRELLELDYLVLLHIISAVYEATEFSREISIGQIMDACDVVSDMTKRHPDFRHQFPELTCTTCSPPRQMNILCLFFSYWTHTHRGKRMQRINVDAPNNSLWNLLKNDVRQNSAYVSLRKDITAQLSLADPQRLKTSNAYIRCRLEYSIGPVYGQLRTKIHSGTRHVSTKIIGYVNLSPSESPSHLQETYNREIVATASHDLYTTVFCIICTS